MVFLTKKKLLDFANDGVMTFCDYVHLQNDHISILFQFYLQKSFINKKKSFGAFNVKYSNNEPSQLTATN